MRSLHLQDLHFPKGPNLFVLSVGEVIWFSLALFFFLLSWLIGGDEFADSIGGYASLGWMLAGLAVGAILCAVTKPRR